ncbi:hypothetical protein V5799_006130 [Amblyomma americanum]|uniref:3',5'-cyclic-AMP phosphodiesterase n=1 Tax=Amblyomma americanum TaxID=6943 RepID=A0AAQ4DXA0_AMBAM
MDARILTLSTDGLSGVGPYARPIRRRRRLVASTAAQPPHDARRCSEGPVYYNAAGGAGHHQPLEQQGAYDNGAYQNAEQVTSYDYGYNAGYLAGYKAAYRRYKRYRSWSYADYSDAGGKNMSTSTKEFRVATKARLIALIVLCSVVTAALLVVLAYQLFLSEPDRTTGYRVGADGPFPPLAVPKKMPANDSSTTGCKGLHATPSPPLHGPEVPEERLRMRAPMNIKAAPEHSGGHGGATLKTTSRSARNVRRSVHKAYKRRPTGTTSESVSTASWFTETCSLGACLNEMLQIEHNDLINLWKLEAAEALFAALHYSRDGVMVTGPSHDIQFMNRAAEKLAGYSAEEMLGENAQSLHRTASLKADVAGRISTQLDKGRHWEGALFHRRKSGECMPVWCKIAPVDLTLPGLECDDDTISNWLQLVESNYRDNPYHNSTHAGDVMQATAYFLIGLRKKNIFDPLDEAICLVAAVIHDVDHPGRSTSFLCNANHELAILYNDRSVLETHHAALGFKLTLSSERVNIFANLERDAYRSVRASIIDMVLATEMTKHFEHLSKFLNAFQMSAHEDEAFGPEDHGEMASSLCSADNIVLIKRMLIKCADVSNPARPIELCVQWAQRISEEYCAQVHLHTSQANTAFPHSSL